MRAELLRESVDQPAAKLLHRRERQPADRHREIEAHHEAELGQLGLELVDIDVAVRSRRGARYTLWIEHDQMRTRE